MAVDRSSDLRLPLPGQPISARRIYAHSIAPSGVQDVTSVAGP
jgi:hypothetical protein